MTFHKNDDVFVDYKFACNKFREIKESILDGAPFPKRQRLVVHTKWIVFTWFLHYIYIVIALHI